MKKLLFFLSLFPASLYAGQQVKYVQISTGALQAGTTAGFNVSSGTVLSFNANTITGTGTNGTAAIKGTITNDEAATSYIGEFSTGTWGPNNNGSYANSAPNNQCTSVSTISIPSAGDWTVYGNINSSLNGATMTRSRMAISQFSNNTQTDQQTARNDIDIPVPTAASSPGGTLIWRFECTTATTLYVKGCATFSAGQPQYIGFGWAERRR